MGILGIKIALVVGLYTVTNTNANISPNHETHRRDNFPFSNDSNDSALIESNTRIQILNECGDGFKFTLNLRTDGYAEETSWDLISQYGASVASMGAGRLKDKMENIYSRCLPHGCYTFKIHDSFGDGMNQHTNNGSYKGYVNGKETFYGGEFLSHATNGFCTGKFSKGCVDGGSEFEFKLDLMTDVFGNETSWNVMDFAGRPVLYENGPFPPTHKSQISTTLPGGCYTFNLYDSWGDGFCCSHGKGEATGYIDEGITFHVKSFESVFSSSFCNCGNFPSVAPTGLPTASPSASPSSSPTYFPSNAPSTKPTSDPSASPSNIPTIQPTSLPTTPLPTSLPSTTPTELTNLPTVTPSITPSSTPSVGPTVFCGTNKFFLEIETVTIGVGVNKVPVGDDLSVVQTGGISRKSPTPAQWKMFDSDGQLVLSSDERDTGRHARTSSLSSKGGCFRKGCYTFSFIEDEVTSQANTKIIGFVAGKEVEFSNGSDGTKSFCSTGCKDSEFFFELELITDSNSNETYWDIRDSTQQVMESKPPGSYQNPSTLYTENLCLVKGCYSYYVYDTWGDGICCDFGEGHVHGFVDGKSAFQGNDFGKIYGWFFCG